MLLMLVDHTRERMLLHQQVTDPISLSSTPPGLALTRLLTHFCAPAFVFLAGLAAYLYAHPRHAPQRAPGGFLLRRGLLLVALELTVVTFAWEGRYHTLWLQVIWATGISMIALAGLAQLPTWLRWATAILVLAGHNVLSPIHLTPSDSGYAAWTVLHQRGYLVSQGILRVKVSYPVLPWVFLMLLGYNCGPLFADARFGKPLRARVLCAAGLAGWLLVSLLRLTTNYGEPSAWQPSGDPFVGLLSFVNFTKYPPSLDFLLLNLGAVCLLLGWFESCTNESRALQALARFGAAPMFFYLLHLYVLLALYEACLFVFGPNHSQRFGFSHVGYCWALALALATLLYGPTRAFAALKQRTRSTWLRYL